MISCRLKKCTSAKLCCHSGRLTSLPAHMDRRVRNVDHLFSGVFSDISSRTLHRLDDKCGRKVCAKRNAVLHASMHRDPFVRRRFAMNNEANSNMCGGPKTIPGPFLKIISHLDQGSACEINVSPLVNRLVEIVINSKTLRWPPLLSKNYNGLWKPVNGCGHTRQKTKI